MLLLVPPDLWCLAAASVIAVKGVTADMDVINRVAVMVCAFTVSGVVWLLGNAAVSWG